MRKDMSVKLEASLVVEELGLQFFREKWNDLLMSRSACN